MTDRGHRPKSRNKKKRHPKKEVADAIGWAAEKGWSAVTTSGHRWGFIECPGCRFRISIWSTPRNPYLHAIRIRGEVRRHEVGEHR